ncbi:hypothetical protein GCM10010503_20990 [Streptomyces lucensis JCM 4490]|uniref:Coenzyme PQQ synthesis protein A n=1 Tax=Streptomyces lucensis JCM 4490 TaxID=1306176 RepID=A0A918J285_9ACTN|nr:pyrroloquinoline quinone precursor peptide PqqA [Streptomyces lucensis]GGW44077.1 hypothetical protein GCM10010503_20990 [Streptomyces lucensis JCM 4490]
MTEAGEHIEQPATAGEEPDRTVWQTPGYVVVDTALEVTAYYVTAR